MKNLKNKVAAVTGAGQGIGRMLSIDLAKEGCVVAIADVNIANLEETAELIESQQGKVTKHLINVANRDEVYRFAEDVNTTHGRVDLVINNAGVLLWELLEEVSYDDFEWIMGINFWGVVYGTKAFLPFLKRQQEGHIVNICSAGVFAPAPTTGPYVVSKSAVSAFTQTLWQELKQTHINVSCVYPGGVKSNIFRTGRIYKTVSPQMNHKDNVKWLERNMARTTADQASQVIIAGIKKNKSRILVGLDAHIFYWMWRFVPDLTLKLMESFAAVKLFKHLKKRTH